MQGTTRLGLRGISAPTLERHAAAQGAGTTEDLLELRTVPECSGGTVLTRAARFWGRAPNAILSGLWPELLAGLAAGVPHLVHDHFGVPHFIDHTEREFVQHLMTIRPFAFRM